MNNLPVQLLLLILGSIIIILLRRLLHSLWPQRLRYYDFWPLFTLYLSALNLSWNWFPYVMIGWMTLGILIVIVQIISKGELLYRRFFPVFWRVSVVYTTIAYLCSIFYRFMG
ncbi:DUF3397 family protein [Paucilactobacillus kaifaensis]|uniref:DUF3397 family protein n=1 Tax=Paucilactobacillus kaifaensis TaxID=2559921 RepID=UPI001CC807DC